LGEFVLSPSKEGKGIWLLNYNDVGQNGQGKNININSFKVFERNNNCIEINFRESEAFKG